MFPSVGPFFVVFSVFLIYFCFFLMISICFPADLLNIYFKKCEQKGRTSKPNQHIMADDFGISELVTLAPGFARAALRATARGLHRKYIYVIDQMGGPFSKNILSRSQKRLTSFTILHENYFLTVFLK